MNEAQSLQLIEESILGVGEYYPSQKFIAGASIAIMVNQRPVLLLGYSSDENAYRIADRLLACPEFIQLINFIYANEDNHISKGIVLNRTLTQDHFKCLMTSKQGHLNHAHECCEVEAIAVEHGEMLTFSICVNSAIMLCFYPEAKPLSIQVELKNRRSPTQYC